MWLIILAILSPAILFGLYVVTVILYGTITDYSPPEKETVGVSGNSIPISGNEFSFVIWNIGYGGLGKDVDFFYDGGENVITDKELVTKYQEAIFDYVESNAGLDFVLLQEVDIKSKRSHGTNQFESIGSLLTNHEAGHAMNYNCKFIPIPFTKPLGKIQSGLASYSKYTADETTRYSFPGNFSWPKRVFFLDRCYLLQRFSLSNGKDFVVINTHNSAYDDGSLKAGQMDYLKDRLEEEYAAGNYIVVGGDWNQCPPGFQFDKFAKSPEETQDQANIEADYLPNWRWVYDSSVPTNRKLSSVYDPEKSFTTVIDFYLISPNIDLINVEGIDQQFAYSDHQPVLMNIKLKGLE